MTTLNVVMYVIMCVIFWEIKVDGLCVVELNGCCHIVVHASNKLASKFDWALPVQLCNHGWKKYFSWKSMWRCDVQQLVCFCWKMCIKLCTGMLWEIPIFVLCIKKWHPSDRCLCVWDGKGCMLCKLKQICCVPVGAKAVDITFCLL